MSRAEIRPFAIAVNSLLFWALDLPLLKRASERNGRFLKIFGNFDPQMPYSISERPLFSKELAPYPFVKTTAISTEKKLL